MCDDQSSDPCDWSIAKRKRVEASLVPGSSFTADHRDQLFFKRYRAAQGGDIELAMTAKKSGGDKKRNLQIEQKELAKADVEKEWLDGDWGSQNFRNLITCCAVDQMEAIIRDDCGQLANLAKIAEELIDSGDFDGCDPPLGARGLVTQFYKMRNDEDYEPKCQGGRPTILNSTTSEKFWEFLQVQLKETNPTGQSGVKSREDFIVKTWHKFYSKNDATIGPDIKPKTMKQCLEKMEAFTFEEPARKKNARGAEAMDDPRNFIAFGAVCNATMAGVPDDLKLNYDDVTFMVAEDMGVVKICYGHKDVQKAMRELGRSMAWHYEEDGPQKQVRMFVCGFLSTGRGKVPVAVVKFYDRRIQQPQRIMHQFIGTAGNGCEMHWVSIKLSQDGNGSNDDEEVNRLVMRDIVARGVTNNKQEFIDESRRIIQHYQETGENGQQLPELSQPSPLPQGELHVDREQIEADHYMNSSDDDDEPTSADTLEPVEEEIQEYFLFLFIFSAGKSL
jgi:hypothetical protein